MSILFVDHEDFLPSRWNGTYNCSSDNRVHRYDLEITKSLTSIGINGFLYVSNYNMSVRGTYAYSINFLTLQSNDLAALAIFGNNFTGVEIDVFRRSSTFMQGSILFKNGSPSKTICTTELHRNAGWYNVSLATFRQF